MPHTGTAHFRSCNFNTTLLAHNTLIAHLLVLPAQTLIVSYRTENLRTEKPVSLRFECTIVDSFRFFDLAVTP